jgi:hypothetical protein
MASNPSSEPTFDLQTLSADDILTLFNDALSTDIFSSLSEEELTEGIMILYDRITSETDDSEREKLLCVFTKISQIVQIDNLQYLIDSL